MKGYGSARTVVAILAMLVLATFSMPAAGFIDTTNPHNEGDFTPGGAKFCAVCHAGFPGPSSAEVDRVVDNYRCLSCHYSLSLDYRSLVNATMHSPHKTIGCTRCHDTFHATHTRWMPYYSTSTRGRFGCWREHVTATHDYNPPQGATIFFLDTYYLNSTAAKSFNLVWRTWFYDTYLSGTSEFNVYTYVFVDPYTGSETAIPQSKAYEVCLKCHFVNKASSTTLTSTYFVDHPAICYSCHSNTTGYTSNYILEPHAVMEHSVTSSWDSCRNCHANLAQAVDNSIHGHKGVGCRCHSMIHVSKYNGSASWVYLYPSPATKDYVSPECTMCHFVHGATTDVTWWRTVFYYNSTNATTFNVPIYPFSAAGDTKYANVFYLMRSGDATPITGPEMRWATCLNCHFIAGTSGGALPARFEGRIPLPEDALRNIEDPHSIQPLSSGESGVLASEGWGFVALAVAIAAIAALIVLMGRARQ